MWIWQSLAISLRCNVKRKEELRASGWDDTQHRFGSDAGKEES
jgi:hypothetical protein